MSWCCCSSKDVVYNNRTEETQKLLVTVEASPPESSASSRNKKSPGTKKRKKKKSVSSVPKHDGALSDASSHGEPTSGSELPSDISYKTDGPTSGGVPSIAEEKFVSSPSNKSGKTLSPLIDDTTTTTTSADEALDSAVSSIKPTEEHLDRFRKGFKVRKINPINSRDVILWLNSDLDKLCWGSKRNEVDKSLAIDEIVEIEEADRLRELGEEGDGTKEVRIKIPTKVHVFSTKTPEEKVLLLRALVRAQDAYAERILN